ncbi:MAG: MarR family transcriptional regulator [Aliidongia sp.]
MVPSALAEALGMTRGAVSKLADRLCAKALLTRTAQEEDRRFQALALTAQGRALVPELSALADRNDAEFFGHLTEAERAGVEAVLQDIVRRHGMRTVPTE